MENIWKILIIAFLLLLFSPFKISIKVFYNVFLNRGKFSFMLFSKRLLEFEFFIKNGAIELITKTSKKQVSLNTYDPNFIFYNELQKNLFKRIILKKFKATFSVGVENNPFLTSMLSGFMQMILASLFGVMSAKKIRSDLKIFVKTSFDKEVLNLLVSGSFYVSIIAVLLSVLDAYIKKIKRGVVKQNG